MKAVNVPIQIRFGDVDMARHVHNAVDLHWFEAARMASLQKFITQKHNGRREGLSLF